jgi:FkbH-like protein
LKAVDITSWIKQAKDAGTWLAHRQGARKINEAFVAKAIEPKVKVKTAFLSSYTIDPLVDYIVVNAAERWMWVDSYVAAYNQFNQEILNPGGVLKSFSPEMTVLSVEFEALAAKGDCPAAAERLISLAEAFKHNHSGFLVITNFMVPPQWPLHIIADEKTRAMKDANAKLTHAFSGDTRVQVCDLDSLSSYYGYQRAISPEMLNMARCPFSEGFLSLLSEKIISHIKAQKGLVRKCLVLDCDNTLWGGIIGEDGFDGILLGPDSPGREYVEFQKAVLELYEQGVILAINSRNNYNDVIEVLHKHRYMVLREEHFASIQINWDDKPANMKTIAKELNIGIDSFVFVDDNPAERAMMREMLPEVCTPELPENPSLYARALRESSEFAKAYLTKEDLSRGQIYASQRQREQLRKNAPNLEDFLESLQMVISIRQAKQSDVKRLAQLTQRTNQFNVTTRRYSEDDITGMLKNENYRVYALDLRDKFGDNGTVGETIVEISGSIWRIDAFLMSCRVIGRSVEDAMVDRILCDAKAAGAETITADYIKTEKNQLVSDFWDRMGFEKIDAGLEHSNWRFSLAGFKPKKFKYLRFEQ